MSIDMLLGVLPKLPVDENFQNVSNQKYTEVVAERSADYYVKKGEVEKTILALTNADLTQEEVKKQLDMVLRIGSIEDLFALYNTFSNGEDNSNFTSEQKEIIERVLNNYLQKLIKDLQNQLENLSSKEENKGDTYPKNASIKDKSIEELQELIKKLTIEVNKKELNKLSKEVDKLVSKGGKKPPEEKNKIFNILKSLKEVYSKNKDNSLGYDTLKQIEKILEYLKTGNVDLSKKEKTLLNKIISVLEKDKIKNLEKRLNVLDQKLFEMFIRNGGEKIDVNKETQKIVDEIVKILIEIDELAKGINPDRSDKTIKKIQKKAKELISSFWKVFDSGKN